MMHWPMPLEEYKALLSELTRIRSMRAMIPPEFHAAVWPNQDIDTLIRIIWAQGIVIQNFHLLAASEAALTINGQIFEAVILDMQRELTEMAKRFDAKREAKES